MSVCSYCSNTILFGGVSEGDKLFCSARCRESAVLLQRAHKIPYRLVVRKVDEFYQGPCPICGGSGPVDVHWSYRICSAVLVSRWTSVPNLCCRRCAVKAQFKSLLYSLCLGWWSVPWGLLMTPVQLYRNVRALLHRPPLSRPSAELERLVRVGLAARVSPQKLVEAQAHGSRAMRETTKR